MKTTIMPAAARRTRSRRVNPRTPPDRCRQRANPGAATRYRATAMSGPVSPAPSRCLIAANDPPHSSTTVNSVRCARVGFMVLRDCAGMPYTKRIEIRWRDMDGFGHVNNAVYLTYLEEARDEFYTQLLGHDTVGRMVARRVEIDFLSGLVQDDDEVDVELEVTRIGSSSVTTSERLIAVSDGRVAARSETVMVHTDDERANAAPLPEEARRLLEGVAAA